MQPETHTLDASRETLGRIASRAAALLMGKHRPSFRRHNISGDRVVVIQSDNLKLSGRKWQQKMYYRHSGYLGNLRSATAARMRERDSREIVRLAVRGMLPKNRLRTRLMRRLDIYRGEASAQHRP